MLFTLVVTATSGGRGSPTTTDRALDVLVAVAVVATIVLWFRVAKDSWFFADEWLLALRGRTPGDFLEPYNGHLSITYIAIYRAHMAAFGMDHYWVIRLVALFSLAAIPTFLYVTTLGRWGRPTAAFVSVAVLWVQAVSIEPGAMNHYIVLALTVLSAWALREPSDWSGRLPERIRGRRVPWTDVVLAVTLTLGLMTAGGAVAVVAAAGVHCLLTRARWTRWMAVVVPALGWAAWYVLVLDPDPIPVEYRLSTWETVRLVFEGQFEAMRGLALGWTAGGVFVTVVVVLLTVRRLWVDRWQGFVALAPWWVAMTVWWVGLASSRGALTDPATFRYRLAGAVFLILSLVPPRREAEAAARAARARFPWTPPPWVAVAGVAAVLALLVAVNLDDTREAGQELEAYGRVIRLQQLVAFTDPPPPLPSTPYGFGMGGLTGAELDEIRVLYGPSSPTGSALDEALLDVGAVQLDPLDGPPQACPRGRPVADVGVMVQAVVTATDVPVTVTVRRFGREPQTVGEVPAGTSARLIVSTPDTVRTGWRLSTDGGCTAAG